MKHEFKPTEFHTKWCGDKLPSVRQTLIFVWQKQASRTTKTVAASRLIMSSLDVPWCVPSLKLTKCEEVCYLHQHILPTYTQFHQSPTPFACQCLQEYRQTVLLAKMCFEVDTNNEEYETVNPSYKPCCPSSPTQLIFRSPWFRKQKQPILWRRFYSRGQLAVFHAFSSPMRRATYRAR